MTDNPASQSLQTEDLAQLRARAADAAARTRELIEAVRAAREQAASLLAENRMLLDEVRFRRLARRKRSRFP